MGLDTRFSLKLALGPQVCHSTSHFFACFCQKPLVLKKQNGPNEISRSVEALIIRPLEFHRMRLYGQQIHREDRVLELISAAERALPWS
jgi:hypothetical protein